MIRTNGSLGLYLMTVKGVAVLRRLLLDYGPENIAYVVTAADTAMVYDGYGDILKIAHEMSIPVYSRSETPSRRAEYLLSISWRWIIKQEYGQKLVVFHDSLLPRYRGFAPLISALVNGDLLVGVTAIFASEEYDKGPIIAQEMVSIQYPITIAQAIEVILPCYEKLASDITVKLLSDGVKATPQLESEATYSLWRDDHDYYVNWSWSADRIRRFIDAVGFPYRGAAVVVEGKLCRIRKCEVRPDVVIENRTDGKVIFVEEGKPVVVCGQGLLKILHLTEDGSEQNLLPLQKFRVRFIGPS